MHLNNLYEKIKQSAFQDAKKTTNDPSLVGPPTLEFAAFGRVPGTRVRKDGRQGTIDQDPEFIVFLESLTSPVTKPLTSAEGGADGQGYKEEKVTITPLVQYIKDKKANKSKEKEASALKAPKHSRQDSKDIKAEKADSKKTGSKKDVAPSQDKNAKLDKVAKDAVRVVNKQAAAIAKRAANQESPTPAVDQATPTTPKTEKRRERERGSAAAAAKILQRDLGLGSSTRPERKRERSSRTEFTKDNAMSPMPDETAFATTDAAAAPVTVLSPQITSPKPILPPTGPAAIRNKTSTPITSQALPSPATKSARANPMPSPDATQAFLKHANPSQGVTEPLLEAAFSGYGGLLKVEIDKKKGFGYLDFESPEGLAKAMAASPVKVGQSNVVVLERKSASSAKSDGQQPAAVLRGGNSIPPRGPHSGGPLRGTPMRGGGAITRGGLPTRGGPTLGRGGRGNFRGRGGMGRGGGTNGDAAQAQSPLNSAVASTTTPSTEDHKS